MADPFIGEIRMGGWNFAPLGWAFCDGSLQSIAQNDTLFVLIGTIYGGNGQDTFALPDFRGRVPVHLGTNLGNTYPIGQVAGSETVAVTANQMPAHTHNVPSSSSSATSTDPSGRIPAASSATPYAAATATGAFGSSMVGNSGGSQPHENMMPFQCVTFVISLFGIFPSRN